MPQIYLPLNEEAIHSNVVPPIQDTTLFATLISQIKLTSVDFYQRLLPMFPLHFHTGQNRFPDFLRKKSIVESLVTERVLFQCTNQSTVSIVKLNV